MQSKRQTETRVGTFNFSADHGDRFYLQPAHGETEKNVEWSGVGAGGDKETKREREQCPGDGRF